MYASLDENLNIYMSANTAENSIQETHTEVTSIELILKENNIKLRQKSFLAYRNRDIVNRGDPNSRVRAKFHHPVTSFYTSFPDPRI